MNMLDIDWAYMGGTFLVVFALMLVPLGVLAGGKFDDRFGEKLDAFLLAMLRKLDERKARKTR